MINFKPQIQARQADWIARRRDLHQHPELGFQEVRTAGIVAKELTRLGLEVQTGVGKTGVVGVLEGTTDGPTILVRADMDALPVQEENEVEYASEYAGKMHACGHDAHTTIGLAVAELLSEHREQIAGRIKFVFQPAEEIGMGAAAMIEDGVLRDPAPDIALGLHIWNDMPVGHVVVTDGSIMAAANDIQVKLYGKGGHGALPHQTIDPILAAGHIITALQSVVSRNLSPMDVGVISITSIKAGDSFNVIPPLVEMRGTIRAMKMDVRDTLTERFEEIVTSIASALGCRAEIKIEQLTLPVINSPDVNVRLRQVFAEVAPELKQLHDFRLMVSEDMSYFLDAVPGSFFLVGASDPAHGLDYPHHHPRFNFDEAVIPLAADLLASAVASYVIVS